MSNTINTINTINNIVYTLDITFTASVISNRLIASTDVVIPKIKIVSGIIYTVTRLFRAYF